MRDETSLGRKIPVILAGAWRTVPPPLELPANALPSVLPLLQETGAGSLAYGRLHRLGLVSTPAARQLRQTYRLHTLETAIQREQLRDLVQRFGAAGVEPLIVKGWTIGRLYAEPGFRPYGDIDVCVRPEEQGAATAVLTAAAGAFGLVDLHTGVADLEDRRLDAVYQRSRLVPLGDTQVRILGAEDQLRHMCLHLMRHGAWRPLWLCDVGAALESLPTDFDWEYCRSGDRRLTEWMDCAVELAKQLLGAQLRAGAGRKSIALPCWLVPAILRAWQRGGKANDAVTQPLSACLRNEGGLPAALRRRWPNPIRAAFQTGLSPFTCLPRPLTQFGAFSLRACRYVLDQLDPRKEAVAGPFAVHPARLR